MAGVWIPPRQAANSRALLQSSNFILIAQAIVLAIVQIIPYAFPLLFFTFAAKIQGRGSYDLIFAQIDAISIF